MAGYVEKWHAAADDFMSVLLVQPDAWQKAIEYGVTSDDLPDGRWREAYRAVIDLRGDYLRNGAAPVILPDTEVAAKCGTAVSVQWVASLIAAWDEYREQFFDRTCALLRRYGRGHRQLQTVSIGTGRIRAALENGQDTSEAALTVVDHLRHEQTVSETMPTDIGDLTDEIEVRMNQPPDEGVKTGVWLIDNWLRGIAPGEFVAWPSPYKMRKTSVAGHILVNMARDGGSVTLFSYDESRVRFTYRIQALLMAEYMWHNGHWNLCAEDGTPLNVVDGKMIRNAGHRWRKWVKPMQLAREYARDEMQALRGRIRIYDQQTGANSMRSIRAICQHDAMKYGGLTAVFVDHIQRLPGFDKTYDAVEYGSAELHHLGGEMGAIMWVLSQQNEEAIKRADEGGWSPNAKGGGGLASNADTVLISKYKVGTVTDPRYLRIELRLAREAEAPKYGYVEIHPASGWITPAMVNVKTLDLDDPHGGAA